MALADPLALPDFGVDLGPELEAGMAEHRAEIEAIALGSWPPTSADTTEALERAGGRLHLAERLFADASGSQSTRTIGRSSTPRRPPLPRPGTVGRTAPRPPGPAQVTSSGQ